MDIGMLWFDNDRELSLPHKVSRAVRYYQQKYGRDPDLCFTHPHMVSRAKDQILRDGRRSNGKPLIVEGVRVVENDQVLPDHFWIGVSPAQDP